MQEPAGVSQLVEHLFRRESGKMVATLTGIFGIEHLNLAEDVVQEALARALQTWPYRGITDNVRVLSPSYSGGSAGGACLEDTLRLQRAGNQSCIPDDRSSNCKATDARKTKNPGSADSIWDSNR